MSIQSGEQAKLDAYAAASPEPDPEPSRDDERAEEPASAPDGSVDRLAAIFHDIVGEYETVEEQEETPSHDPIEGELDVPDLSDDGLDDAADSDLVMGGWI